MKKLLIFLIFLSVMLVLSVAAFAQFSGETTGTIGIDTEAGTPTYSIDTGVLYTAGVFSIGLDAFTDTFLDVDVGLPIAVALDNFGFTIEPGVDHIFEGVEVFVVDAGLTATLGPVSLGYDVGVGTDEVLSMSASAGISPTDWLALSVDWADGDDLIAGTTGSITLSATATY